MKDQARIERLLLRELPKLRWFGGKSRRIVEVRIHDRIPLDKTRAFLLFQVRYAGNAPPELYATPWIDDADTESATQDPTLQKLLLRAVLDQTRLSGGQGTLYGTLTRAFLKAKRPCRDLRPKLLKAEQSNSTLRFGNELALKLFRRLEPGPQPDIEIGTFLADHTRFRHAPLQCGALEYRTHTGESFAVGSLQAWTPNRGDAWTIWQKWLGDFAKQAERWSRAGEIPEELAPVTLQGAITDPVPRSVQRRLGPLLKHAELLGKRTLELHQALASPASKKVPGFPPQPLAPRARAELARSLSRHAEHVLQAFADTGRPEAATLLLARPAILARYEKLIEEKVAGQLIRTHGDYHLGQVLWTGKDFVILDFEGEPARALAERRALHSPLRDVTGMLRSFHYASFCAPKARAAELRPWFRYWHDWTRVAFLKGYLGGSQGGSPGGSHLDGISFLPAKMSHIEALLSAHLIEKALYELLYEMNNRPDWIEIPIRGIMKELS